MDGEKKLVVVSVSAALICLTVLYGFLFVALWAYKELVGLSLVVVLIALAGVHMRGKLNEQALRRERYHHHEEIPLDLDGEPYYWPKGAQQNPHHQSVQQEQGYGAYGGQQQQVRF